MIDNLLVIVGSAKAGTSSLNKWLSQHPSFRSGKVKEPRFFTDFGTRRWTGPGGSYMSDTMLKTPEAYEQNYQALGKEIWAIDASTDYIWNEAALERLAGFAKTTRVKLIAIVRDPVSRAVSEYNHTLRHDWQKLSFWESVKAEEMRRRDGYPPLFYHKRRSEVHADLCRFHATFGEDLMIVDFNRLSEPEPFLSTVCAFVGVPFLPPQELPKENASLLPRGVWAKKILDSDHLRHLGRHMVPKTVRQAIWQGLHKDSRELKTVSDDEIARFTELMRDEINLCLSDPKIPTDRWPDAWRAQLRSASRAT